MSDREVDLSSWTDAEAVLIENARLEAQLDGLHRALQSRATIEQAKGVVVALAQCAETEAFEVLVQLSQRRNVRLRALAETVLRLASSGFEVPEEDPLSWWLRAELLRLRERRGPARPRQR